jgi:hypothetical protein
VECLPVPPRLPVYRCCPCLSGSQSDLAVLYRNFRGMRVESDGCRRGIENDARGRPIMTDVERQFPVRA